MAKIHELPVASASELANSSLVVDTGAATKRIPYADIASAVEVNDLAKSLAGYNGKDLGQSYTPAAFQAKVLSGDFSGLSLGDYFDITLTTGEQIRAVISGFNPYLNFGDTQLTANHVIMTFLDCMKDTMQMNTSNTNTGGYAASLAPAKMEAILATFPTEWKAVMRSIRRLENNKGTWAWASRTLFLLSETEVHGHPNWATDGYDGGTRPLPLYQYSTRYRIKGLGFGSSAKGSRCTWWLASPISANAADFCYVNCDGFSSGSSASYSYGVAPGFCI